MTKRNMVDIVDARLTEQGVRNRVLARYIVDGIWDSIPAGKKTGLELLLQSLGLSGAFKELCDK